MEDRHVLIHDLNAIYCDNQVSIMNIPNIFEITIYISFDSKI